MSYFDRMAGTWSERYRPNGHFSKRLETALSWLEAPAGQKLQLLDFGCGSGVLMRELLVRGHEVYGVDASRGMLEQARQELHDFSTVSYELMTQDDYAGDYLRQRFDGVFCLGVIEYLERPDLLVDRLASVIRPGGFLVISAPNQGSVLRQVERFVYRHGGWFRAIPRLKHLTGEDSYLRFQKHQFSSESLNEMVRPHGLVPENLSYQVAPRALSLLAGRAPVGMTLFAKYHKSEAKAAVG